MSLKAWNWNTCKESVPCLGPRDWSPGVVAALGRLKELMALVPADRLLSKVEVAECEVPLIVDAVLADTAFVARGERTFIFPMRYTEQTHEVVYVCPEGRIRMSREMEHWFKVWEKQS